MDGPAGMPPDPFGSDALGFLAAVPTWDAVIHQAVYGDLDTAVSALTADELRGAVLRALVCRGYGVPLLAVAEPIGRPADPDTEVAALLKDLFTPLVEVVWAMNQDELRAFVREAAADVIRRAEERRA